MSKKQYVFLLITLFILIAINIFGVYSLIQNDKQNNINNDSISNTNNDEETQEKISLEDMINLRNSNELKELNFRDLVTEDKNDVYLYSDFFEENDNHIIANLKVTVYDEWHSDYEYNLKISDGNGNNWDLKIYGGYLYVHDNYLIHITHVTGIPALNLKIYAFDGSLVYDTDKGCYLFADIDTKGYYFWPFLRDDTLYFVESEGSYDRCDGHELVYIKSVKLDGSNKVETILETYGTTSANC